MKKQKRAKKQKSKKPAVAAPKKTRREVLRLFPMGLVGVAAIGGAGYFGFSAVRAGAAQYDLSRVGAGKPSIVQIHDPQCPTCTALQRETRKALADFGECDLVYLVANIRTGAGHEFAQKHLVPHVTILMFDGDGNLQTTLRGMRQEEELRRAFERHFAAFGRSV